MSTIVAIDEAVVPYRLPDVQAVLADVHRWGEWWPSPWRVSALGEAPARPGTRVRVADGRLLGWEGVLEAIEPRRIELAIDGGRFTGRGRWTLRDVLDGTAVVLRLDLAPRPLWLRLLAWRLDLRKRHSRHVRRLFDALGKRLEATGAERVPEPTGPPERPPERLIL